MKMLFLTLGMSFFLAGVSIPSPADDTSRPITSLQAKGWKIRSKSEERKKLPGLPPYESLARDMHIVYYELEKENGLMICQAAYESQRDRYDETCRRGSP